jgi:hypothetical protein
MAEFQRKRNFLRAVVTKREMPAQAVATEITPSSRKAAEASRFW